MTDVDFTAIPLKLDPEQQRMRGVAVHGHTPFDVPYVSRITDNLWQGGCANGLVLPRAVKHVVSLYPWESYETHHVLDSELRVRMYDGSDEPDEDELLYLADWVNRCRERGLTLVHCQAGLNRSGLVAGLALVLDGMSTDNAIRLLRQTRSPAVLCNRTFEQWLRDFGARMEDTAS